MTSFSPVFALLAGNILLVLGTGLQSVLLPVRAHLGGFSNPMLGLLGAGYYAGFVVGCLTVPLLVRRAGHVRAFATLAVVAAQTFPLHAALPEAWVWVGLRIIAGFCFAGLAMIIESWINEKAVSAMRGRILSVYMVLTSLASAGGQGLLRIGDATGFLPFALVCLCISLSLVPLALSTAPSPVPLTTVRLHPRLLFRTSPAAMIGCLAVGLANGAFWTLAPVFAQLRGASPPDAASFIAAAVLGGAALQWPVGLLSDRLDRRWPMLGAAGGAVVPAVLLACCAHLSSGWSLALVAAFGGCAFQVYGLSVAHANDLAAPGHFVETSGGLLLTFGLGAVAGPLLGSAAMSHLGPGGLFGFIAAVYLALAATIARRMVRRPELPSRERVAVTESPAPSLAADRYGLARWRLRWGVR